MEAVEEVGCGDHEDQDRQSLLAVARFWLFWLGPARKNQRPLTLTLAEINGSPAILYWEEGSLAGVISLTPSAVGIQEIYALLNHEKLAYLQQQLSGSRRRAQQRKVF